MREITLPLNQIKLPILTRSTFIWLVLACLVGLFIATQSIAIVVIGIVVIAFILLSAITPMAGLMILLILAPMRTLIATEAIYKPPLDIGQIALVMFIFSWLVYRITSNQRLFRLTWSPLYVPLFLFLILTGLTGFNALSLGKWFTEWLKWLQVLVLIVIAVDLAKGDNWQWLVFGLVLSGVANALVGIYEFFGGSGALHLLINGRFFRAFGTFGQPNPFGGFMGLLAPIALMAALGYMLRLRSWPNHRQTKQTDFLLFFAGFYILASLIILFGIVVSWSRGAWLGLGGAVIVMALAFPRNSGRGLLLFGLALGLLGLLWLTDTLPRSIIERLSSSTQELFAFEDVRGIDITPDNYAVAERLAHWQAALNMAAYNPWFGVGFGNYEAVYPAYRLINWGEPLGHAHNYYLNILAETGIIGFLGYGKVWISIIWLSWRARQHPDNFARSIIIGLLGTWTYLSIHSFFDNLYVNNLFLHLGLMLGILTILYNQTWKHIGLNNHEYSTRHKSNFPQPS